MFSPLSFKSESFSPVSFYGLTPAPVATINYEIRIGLGAGLFHIPERHTHS